MSEKLPRSVRLQQLHTVFFGCLFLIPVIVLYYKDAIGLGFREFMIGEALFCTTIFLMEIPTGWIADVGSRRCTLIVGTAIYVLSNVFFWQWHTFFGTLVAQSTAGIGVSLMSGTRSALLYETLMETGQEGEYRRLEGFRHGLGLYMLAIASFCGGFLYQINHDLPLICSITAGLLALGVSFLIPEPARHREEKRKNPFVDMRDTAVYALHGHPQVAGIILLSAVLFATTKILLWGQQPYYLLLGLPPAWFGVLMAAGALLGGAGGQFGHRLDGKVSNITVLLICLGIVCVACFAAGIRPGLHGIPLLLSGSAIWGFGWPRVQSAINNRVDSARRATILSTANQMVQLFAIPLLAMTGLIQSHYGIACALLVLAGLLIAAGLVSMALIKGKAGFIDRHRS